MVGRAGRGGEVCLFHGYGWDFGEWGDGECGWCEVRFVRSWRFEPRGDGYRAAGRLMGGFNIFLSFFLSFFSFFNIFLLSYSMMGYCTQSRVDNILAGMAPTHISILLLVHTYSLFYVADIRSYLFFKKRLSHLRSNTNW